ncbi:hypothetical protein KR009_005398 [Drosophila setifemur]|nr:hypothetical protein KR009_005398 [Drosophila setifemur]
MLRIVEKISFLMSSLVNLLSKKCYFYGLIFVVLLYLIYLQIAKTKYIQRLKMIFERRTDIFEDARGSDGGEGDGDGDGDDSDDGFVEEEVLFRDLNPEQSVELHRRQRFQAAAIAIAGPNMTGMKFEEPDKEPNLRRREVMERNNPSTS